MSKIMLTSKPSLAATRLFKPLFSYTSCSLLPYLFLPYIDLKTPSIFFYLCCIITVFAVTYLYFILVLYLISTPVNV